jgi:hypothetical protein
MAVQCIHFGHGISWSIYFHNISTIQGSLHFLSAHIVSLVSALCLVAYSSTLVDDSSSGPSTYIYIIVKSKKTVKQLSIRLKYGHIVFLVNGLFAHICLWPRQMFELGVCHGRLTGMHPPNILYCIFWHRRPLE